MLFRPLRCLTAAVLTAAAGLFGVASPAAAVAPDYTLSLFAGTGSSGQPSAGAALSQNMSYPLGIVVDSNGNVIVALQQNCKIVKITPGGTLSVIAGTGTCAASAPSTTASTQPVYNPTALAIDASDNLYAVESGARRIIKITPAGVLSYIAGDNSFTLTPGPALSSGLPAPTGLARDSSGNFYVGDFNTSRIFKISAAGTLSVFAGTGTQGPMTAGPALSSQLSGVYGLAVDSNDNVYVSNYYGAQIGKITPSGTLSIYGGTGGAGAPLAGSAMSSPIQYPRLISIDSMDNLYIAQGDKYVVTQISSGGTLSIVGGTGSAGAPIPGAATSSPLNGPYGVAAAPNGDLYVTTMYGNRVVKLAAPSVPGAPTSVTSSRGNGQATVTFTPPASDGGTAILDYTVTSDPEAVTSTCNASPCTVTGLTNGTPYTFTVHARNANGPGGESSPATTAVTPATVPGAPTAVSATAGAGQASVAFTPPSDNGGANITQYTATSDPSGITGTCSASPCTVTGLNNGTAYTFTVHATNTVGSSGESTPASNAVTPKTVPGAPTAVSATRGNGQVSVTFTAPSSTGGAPVTSYTATSDPGGLTSTCSASPCTVTGLNNGTAYTFTVHATNTVGSSAESTPPSVAVTPDVVPGAPTAVSASGGAGQASVTFTAPTTNGGTAITSYTATSDPGGLTGTCTASPCTVTGLNNGTAYTFTVHATNSVGSSGESTPASNAVTPKTVPGAPTAPTATPGNGQATVAFTAPVSNGGDPVTSYTVTSDPGNLTATCTASPCIVTGLNNGTAYTFTVHATNTAGNSAESTPPTTGITPATVPGAPTTVAATAGAGQAMVTFTAPSGNGGSLVTGYTATSDPDGITGTCSASPCTVTGLNNGTAYTFTVHATNTAGNSAESTPASAAVTPTTVPGAPMVLTATPGNGQVVVTFTPPGTNGGAAVSSYTVTSNPGSLTGTCVASPCTVTGLSNGTVYTFTVHATNVAGDSAESTPTTQPVTPLPPPPAPGVPVATASASSVTVTWPVSAAANVTGYTVTADPGPATCTTKVTDPTPLTCTLGAVAGTTYTYTVVAESAVGESTPSGPSTAVTATAPAIPPTVPDTQLTLTTDKGDITTAAPGQTLVVIGTGFAPHSTVAITVYSEPTILGEAVTDAHGDFTKSVTVPPTLTGSHSVVALGAAPDGTPRSMKLSINVTTTAAPPLAVTGPAAMPLALYGLALLCAGAALLAPGRRRRYVPLPAGSAYSR